MHEADIPMNAAALKSAFSCVKTNAGCAGVDGVTIELFDAELEDNCAKLRRQIETGAYLPLPLLKILIDKGNGESRALCIPAVRDRVAQTAVLDLIEPILEKEFETCSFAYRKGRSVRMAVDKIQEYYDRGYRWVVDCDIDRFFDSVDHDILMDKIRRLIHDPTILRLIRLWIGGDIWDGERISPIEKGIPQGSPLSPILANLFLDELDEEMLRRGQKFVRYADDFVILCRNPEKAREALELTKDVLGNLALCLDEAEIVSFDHGFRYLGVLFIKSMALRPVGKSAPRKILYYPPLPDLAEYFRERSKETSK